MSNSRMLSNITRPLALVAALAIVLSLTLYGALSSFSSSRARHLNEEWAQKFGTLEEVLERYPSRDSNATALELEPLAARLGINLAPRNLRDPGIDETERKAWKATYRTLQDYIVEQLERPAGPPDAPPPEFGSWLETYGADLDAFVALLLEADPPRWMLHLEDLPETALPNLLGHVQAQKLLAASALVRLHSGDDAAALERLEAAWRLNTAIADDPVLITQLIALMGLELQAATLRHVTVPAGKWPTRLARARPRERIVRSLEFEAWHWTQLDETALGMPTGKLERLALRLAAPYVRLCAADATARLRVELDRLKRLDYLCDRDLGVAGADLVIELPPWNRLGNLALPNLLNSVKRAARAEIDLELTSHVLALRAARAATGRWPVPGAEVGASAACPGDRWEFAVDAEGIASVGLSRKLSRRQLPAIEVPTRFELSPPRRF